MVDSDESSLPTLRLRALDRPYQTITDVSSEIVIALVGPLGTDSHKVRRIIAERLAAFGYHSEEILISQMLIPILAGTENMLPRSPGYRYAKRLIDLGNQIRRQTKNNAVFAIAAAAKIKELRPPGAIQKRAYIISSLKNRQEVEELRKIYGRGFYVLAVYTDRERRVSFLTRQGDGMSDDQALNLVIRDEDEPDDYGQHTREAFHLADFFVADENNDDKLRSSIWRCLDLMFGHPNITPTFNEFSMFMAFSASLRSADLSRQVGAVVTKGREILSTGANDCPAPGGGLYWPEFIGNRVDDVALGRDYKRGGDSNVEERIRLIEDVVRKFPDEQRDAARRILTDSGLKDLTEYGRVVHAEMEALLACARINTSCVGGTMYCTTFPCHNCAKHIIAAGIKEVVYVEPYPKSKALRFHDDAVTTGKVEGDEVKVRFKPFIGVGPRQFFDLFSLSLGAGKKIDRKESRDGKAKIWREAEATPRVPMVPLDFEDFEKKAVEYLVNIVEEERAR